MKVASELMKQTVLQTALCTWVDTAPSGARGWSLVLLNYQRKYNLYVLSPKSLCYQ